MNKSRYGMIAAMMAAGFLGGAASHWLFALAPAQAAGAEPASTVSAREFRLVDKAGATRIQLFLREDGIPVLGLYDAAGKARAGLFVNPDGAPVIALYDKDAKGRASLFLQPDGSPVLNLTDPAGKTIWKAP